jgi:hypothetical protein
MMKVIKKNQVLIVKVQIQNLKMHQMIKARKVILRNQIKELELLSNLNRSQTIRNQKIVKEKIHQNQDNLHHPCLIIGQVIVIKK